MKMGFGKDLLRLLWSAGVLLVVIGSLLPADSSPIKAVDLLGINDKFEHFLAYSVLAFLPAVHERRNFVILSALGTVALGIGLEFGQFYSSGRSFEIADMVADALGVSLGLIIGVPARSSVTVRSFLSRSRQPERVTTGSGNHPVPVAPTRPILPAQARRSKWARRPNPT
jgi:VanZ family protein